MSIHHPRKRFSQNFLKDLNILKKIANVIDIENKNVIEIGPGKGSLTELLIQKANQLVAFEIDYDLIDLLNEKFKNQSNLTIINEDFLKADLSHYQNYEIIANIPYHISTDIVFKIFENYQNFENVVLLVQKEFAQRICANVNSKDYSKLSPSTKLFYDAKYCFDVENNAFWPKPKVTSAVIHLKRRNQKYDINYKDFLDFIKRCFSMRRKTLWNNLKSSNIEYDLFVQACAKMNMKENARPEEFSFDNLLFLYQEIKIK